MCPTAAGLLLHITTPTYALFSGRGIASHNCPKWQDWGGSPVACQGQVCTCAHMGMSGGNLPSGVSGPSAHLRPHGDVWGDVPPSEAERFWNFLAEIVQFGEYF